MARERTFQTLQKAVLAEVAFPVLVLVVRSIELLVEGVDAGRRGALAGVRAPFETKRRTEQGNAAACVNVLQRKRALNAVRHCLWLTRRFSNFIQARAVFPLSNFPSQSPPN
jgi:hypothetical protein